MSSIQHLTEDRKRDKYALAVRTTCISACRAELRDWYEHMINNDAAAPIYDLRTLPNRHDGASMFDTLVWENESSVPISREMFYDFLGDEMLVLLEETVGNTMRQLAKLVPRTLRGAAAAALTSSHKLNSQQFQAGGGTDGPVLARPDVLFSCKECGVRGCRGRRYTAIGAKDTRRRRSGAGSGSRRWATGQRSASGKMDGRSWADLGPSQALEGDGEGETGQAGERGEAVLHVRGPGARAA